MLIQFLIFPPIVRHFGVLKCLKIVIVLYPIVYILTPFAVLLPSQLPQQMGMIAIMFLKCWASIFAFPCIVILLANSASSLRVLGTLNGIATSVSSLGRAVGPAIGGWTFTLGLDKGYIITPWWTLAAFATLGAVPVWWLLEMKGFGGGDETESGPEEEQEAFLPFQDDTPRPDARDIVMPPNETSAGEAVVIEETLEPAEQRSKTLSRDGSHGRALTIRRMSSPIGVR